MRIKKQLLLLLISFSLLISGFAPVASATAQQQLQVAIIPYTPQQNLDFFFLHSAYPLQYFEAENPDEMSVFLSIITPEQKKEYEKAGYTPKIIDEQAGDLEQYYITSTHHHNITNLADQLQNPEYKNVGLALAHQLTEYNTLIKVSKGTSFTHLPIPTLQPMNAKQIHWSLVPPTGRTSSQVQQLFPFTPIAKPNIQSTNEGLPNPFPMFFAIVIPLALIYLIYRPKKK